LDGHALIFTGTYEHSIDAKNRLAIPAELRDQLLDAYREKSLDPVFFYVTIGDGKALRLYTEEAFEQRAAELDRSEWETDELLEYEELLFSMSRRVELDKQGRIRLPEQLLAQVGLGSEVVLIGVKDHIQIRDRKTWQEHVHEVLGRNPGILRNPRRAMKRTVAAAPKEGLTPPGT
jgi:MraZ protein